MEKEIRFNDVELLLIRDAMEGVICFDNMLSPAHSQRSDQIRIERKIEKLLNHPMTEFV